MSDSKATPADFELGREALLEITPAETIGDPAGSVDEGDGVISVYFENTMLGYPGWRWTVSISHVDGFEPSVLETELTPGDSALLSPDWVPWADRLAEYKETQAGLAAVDGDVDADGGIDDEDDDFDDDDINDDDALLHSGDLDGVDIDSLEDDSDDDDDSDDADDDLDEDADDASAFEVHVDEPDQAEPEADDAGPEPPAVTGRKQRGKKQQEDGQGD